MRHEQCGSGAYPVSQSAHRGLANVGQKIYKNTLAPVVNESGLVPG